MPWRIHKKRHLTSFQVIILGFAGVILFGALILMLPISSAQGIITPFHKALFTSTSAVCVTGLVVLDTGSYWSVFGQTVIMFLIQIGGLGVITTATAVFILSGRKISILQRSTMQNAISAPKVGGIVRLMLCTESRRDRSIDEFYFKRNFIDRIDRCVIHDTCFLS